MRQVSLIVIHCSASPNADSLFRGSPGTPGLRNPAQVIDQWHAERGFHRAAEWRARQNPDLAAIGYHYVIDRAGLVLTGRHVDEIGAHAQGYNQKSLGICLVGTDEFSPAQWASLAWLVTAEVARLTGRTPGVLPSGRNGPGNRNDPLTRTAVPALAALRGIRICGHRNLPDVHKTCPGFEVAPWLESGMANPTGAA